uniref:Snurportin-1 n=1 Tax=Clastoptera arizonana TaxID=38151 RepID=A0A1B6CLR8_9HEMI
MKIMDEIISNWNISLDVHSSKNVEVQTLHPRSLSYKSKQIYLSTIDDRRRTILAEQKENRLAVIERFRGLFDKENFMEWHDIEKKRTHPCRKKIKELINQLMYSEWLWKAPSDCSEWLVKLCPVGKRVVLLAKGGKSFAFYKNGLYKKLHTNLPGGNMESIKDYCVLDCIYNNDTDFYYVLDVLYWKLCFLNSTCDFRFYWLNNKFKEENYSPKLGLLQSYPISDLERILNVHPHYSNDTPKLDGVLFYHKQALYEPGITPLVGWLKPFMVPTIMNIPVHCNYVDGIDLNNIQEIMAIENQHYYSTKKKGKRKTPKQKTPNKFPESMEET